MQCCVSLTSISPYLSFLVALSLSLSLSKCLLVWHVHVHIHTSSPSLFAAFLLVLSYPLKAHCLSFCYFMEVLRYVEGVQVKDHISRGWKALIVFLCMPCACLRYLPAIIEGWVLLIWDTWQVGTFKLCIEYQIPNPVFIHGWKGIW